MQLEVNAVRQDLDAWDSLDCVAQCVVNLLGDNQSLNALASLSNVLFDIRDVPKHLTNRGVASLPTLQLKHDKVSRLLVGTKKVNAPGASWKLPAALAVDLIPLQWHAKINTVPITVNEFLQMGLKCEFGC